MKFKSIAISLAIFCVFSSFGQEIKTLVLDSKAPDFDVLVADRKRLLVIYFL